MKYKAAFYFLGIATLAAQQPSSSQLPPLPRPPLLPAVAEAPAEEMTPPTIPANPTSLKRPPLLPAVAEAPAEEMTPPTIPANPTSLKRPPLPPAVAEAPAEEMTPPTIPANPTSLKRPPLLPAPPEATGAERRQPLSPNATKSLSAATDQPDDEATDISESPFNDIAVSKDDEAVTDNSRRPIVKFTDAPFNPVMRLLAKQAGVSYIEPVFREEDEPNLSIELFNATPLEAFTTIAEYRGFEITNMSGVYTLDRPDLIGAQAMLIKKYKLRWLNPMWTIQEVAGLLGIEIEKPDKNLRTYPEPEDQFTGGGGGGSGGDSGGGGGSGSGGAQGQTDSQIVGLPQKPRWTTTVPFDNPPSKGGFMSDQNGQESVIFVDRRDNALVIRASRSEHRVIAKYLGENDRPEYQIAIDVKIIEVLADSSLIQGTDWNRALGAAGGLTFKLNTPAEVEGQIAQMNFNPAQFIFMPAGFILDWPTAEVTFRNFMRKEKGQALSVPRVITKSGVPVTIRSGVQDPVPVQTLIANGDSTNNQSFTSDYNIFTTGITMDTVATVFDDGYIDLNVNPVVSRKIGEKLIPGTGPVPIISTRMASTTVSVRSGETVVIGGLYEMTYADTRTGVPPFDRIPFLGHLIFGDRQPNKTRRNLIIFVTPRLIAPGTQVVADLGPQEADALERGDRLDSPLTVEPVPKYKPAEGLKDAHSTKVNLAPPVRQQVTPQQGN